MLRYSSIRILKRGMSMEKEKNSKFIIITSLILAVVGLSLGLAAFSSTLKISSLAYVSPSSDNFKIYLSNNTTSIPESSEAITDVISTSGATAGTASLINPSIDGNYAPSVTGIHADFTAPGQMVTYTFYVLNKGKYDAYLNSITFENVKGKSSPKICTAIDNSTDSNSVSAACEDISINIKVGESLPTAGSIPTISNHQLQQSLYEKIVVTVSYASDGVEAKGPFDVAFGDIKLVYGTID